MLPIIFDSQFFTLFSYPLFMGLAWGFGFYFTKSIFEKHQLDTKPLNLLFLGIFIFAWLGAKVFFLWFSSGPKIYQYIYANYFWLGGGFVFYGGLIFGLIYFFIWSLWLKKFPIEQSKYLIPGLVFGHAIGRVGCLLAGCCYGALTDSSFSILINGEHRYPVQAIESIGLILIGFLIMNLIKNNANNLKVIATYLLTYSILRYLLEFFRGDEIRGVYLYGQSTSQIISLLLIIVTLIYIVKPNKKSLHH